MNKKESWNDGSLLAIELDTPLGPGGKLDLHIVIHVESAPRLGRAIFEALEGHKTKNKTFAWAKRKKIAPVPTELNGNFNDNVSADVMSYVSQELPSITAQIKRTALKYSKAVS